MSDLSDLKELTKAKAAQEMKELNDRIIERLSSIKRDGIDELIKYLVDRTDYFTAPASTKFHSNFDGGLAFHSNNVVELLIQKNKQYKIGLSEDTIYLTGYLHDLCKCNLYEKTMRLFHCSYIFLPHQVYVQIELTLHLCCCTPTPLAPHKSMCSNIYHYRILFNDAGIALCILPVVSLALIWFAPISMDCTIGLKLKGYERC